MENASKALMIAGGVLIAVMIITLLAYMYISMSGIFKSEDEIKQIAELEAYNKEYESYNRKLLRGADIISLMNKAISNNKKYEDVIDEYEISIKFELIEDLAAYRRIKIKNPQTKKDEYETKVIPANSLKKGGMYAVSKEEDDAYKVLFDRSVTVIDTFNDFKRRVFNCVKVTYKKENGRIDTMEFKEQKINYTEEF